nr:MAG TPA: hypothetical protein [Bacteriophage sp.]
MLHTRKEIKIVSAFSYQLLLIRIKFWSKDTLLLTLVVIIYSMLYNMFELL